MGHSSPRIRVGARTGHRQAFSPNTGLFYANATRGFSVYYLYENENDEKPQGWGGNDRGGWSEAMLQAIDYKTGKIKWSHKWDGSSSVRSGLLSTAGNLVFAGDATSNFVALNATTGEPLWHSRLHASITNGPDHVRDWTGCNMSWWVRATLFMLSL